MSSYKIYVAIFMDRIFFAHLSAKSNKFQCGCNPSNRTQYSARLRGVGLDSKKRFYSEKMRKEGKRGY